MMMTMKMDNNKRKYHLWLLEKFTIFYSLQIQRSKKVKNQTTQLNQINLFFTYWHFVS